jgi:hypothetical protein
VLDPRGRSRVIALILSGIFPGLSQFYNRQLLKGAIGLVLGLALSWLAGQAAPSDPSAFARPGGALLASLCALLAPFGYGPSSTPGARQAVADPRGQLLRVALVGTRYPNDG